MCLQTMPSARHANESQQRLQEQVERLREENERLRDLVRYCRSDLHHEGLITDEEYAALVSDNEAKARLEGYDRLRDKMQNMRGEVFQEAIDVARQWIKGDPATNATQHGTARKIIRALEMRKQMEPGDSPHPLAPKKEDQP